MNTFETFSKLHQQDKPLLLANAWDAGSAKVIESLGAKAIATTSAGVAWAQGYADGNKMTAAVNAAVAKNITRVIKVPLTVDFENGYSNDPATVAENIKLLLDAGVAGINIEDGTANPDLLSKKIEIIKRTVESEGSQLFINVRTDVYLAKLVTPADMVGETIKRGKQYLAAGADGIFVPVIVVEDDIKQVADNVALPLNVLAISGLPATEKLAGLGVKRISAGAAIPIIVWQTVKRNAALFLDGKTTSFFEEVSMPGGELQQLFG